MPSSIFLETLRDQRWPVLIGSLVLASATVAAYVAYGQLDPARIESLADNPAFVFFDDPVAVGTPSGFVTFRYGFFFALVLSIFAMLLGGRLLRAEESRGSLELVLARPRSRGRVLTEKVLATVTSLFILGLGIAVGSIIGEDRLHQSVSVGRALLAGFNLSLLLFVYAMLALLISQYVQRPGSAAALAGGVYAISFVLNGTGRIYHSAAWVRRLSPNYYFDLSKPLIADYGTRWAAMALLLALGLLLLAVSASLFARRDLGSVATPPLVGGRLGSHRTPSSRAAMSRAAADWSSRSVLLRSLSASGPALCRWTLGVFVYAAYGSGIAKLSEQQLRELLRGSSLGTERFAQQLLASNNGFLSLMVFTFASIVVMLYALMRSAEWPSNQDNGRLDMILSAPHHRWSVALQTYLAALFGFVVLALATGTGVVFATLITHMTIDTGRVFAASFALVPPMTVVAGAVYLLGARLRVGTVMGVVGAYLSGALLIELVGSLLNFPSWVLRLSIFDAYGRPMLTGFDWVSSGTMLAIGLAATAAGILLFQTGDLVERR
jgi:ABC-2 type transport system permease protein